MIPAIEVRHLTKRFGAFAAVDDLSFEVAPGEVFGLLGSNGAGKSTAIRMLCGLLTPSSGELRVLDVDAARAPEEIKRRIGYMTQRFSLYDDLTVAQNLSFWGGVHGLSGRRLAARAREAAEAAELRGRERTLTGELPPGIKQRLALACALLHEPRVVFLDEPTGGVDPLSRRRFWALIAELAQAGITVLVTTHYLDEAEHCDRLALMHAGRLVALGTVREMKEVFAGRVVLEVACPRALDALDALEALPGVFEAALFGTRLHLVARSEADVSAAVRERLAIDGNLPVTIERIVPSLGDAFIHYVAPASTARAAGSRA
jgi:ABC-2 type transport system ATP-binding protein